MPKQKTDSHRDPDAFVQEADPRGRVRLDRPHTATEAQEMDAENAQAAEDERARRFEGRAG